MRVAITGATGNVGTSLVELLVDEPAVTSVVGVARRRPEWDPPRTEWVEADVAGDDLRPAFRGADAVVHLAWLFQPTHDPVATWQANAVGSSRVFEAAAEAGAKCVIHASSVGAYSPRQDAAPVDERWPTHALPTSTYGREKSYVERVLDSFESRHPDIRVVRMRPAFIFKRESATAQRRLFAGPLVPGSLVRPRALPFIPFPRDLVFQALHTRDAADAYRLALLRPVSGPFNLAADPLVDARTAAAMFGKRPIRIPAAVVRAALTVGWRMHALPADPKLFDLARTLPVMDASRARSELGWSPDFTATEAVREFVAGLQQGTGFPTPPLDPASSGLWRWREFASGVGERSSA